MKKIGLVTFFQNYNYGSVLQCFAMQSVLEELGCEVKELKQTEKGLYWFVRRLFIKIAFVISCIFYPERFIKYKRYLQESQRSCLDISTNVRFWFDSFVSNYLHSENVSFYQMKKDDSFHLFICGSDQVWSLSAPMLNPFMFLQFASKAKRVSYAASTGTDIIPPWYKRRLKRYIDSFDYVSVREPSLIPSLKSIDCNKVQSHLDPTLLRTSEFWIKNSSLCPAVKSKNYIVLFFLNKPSFIAIKHIKQVIKNQTIAIYAFPYQFESYHEISDRIQKIDVSPTEFIRVFSDAELIFTDSFHGVAFSINLKKEFYVYNREYAAGTSQNARIECVLKQFNLSSRLILDPQQDGEMIGDYSNILEKERQRSLKYLKEVLS